MGTPDRPAGGEAGLARAPGAGAPGICAPARWALYRRISTADQATNHSMAAQTHAAEGWVAARGGAIVAVYEDQESGRTDRRPGFARLIEGAHDRLFDAVVVHKFDRFSRDRKDSVVYKALLKKINIRVYSVLEPTDPDSPGGVLFEGMLEVFGEFYSANLAQEVRKGLAQRARAGLHVGPVPYGYRLEGGLLVGTEALADVRAALALALAGTATDLDIARMLNARGPRAGPGGTLLRFGRAVARRLVTHPAYAGYVRYRGEVFPGRHEALITPEEHRAILRARARYGSAPRQNRRSPRAYPLTGLVRCRCGGPMNASHAQSRGLPRTTYRCAWRGRGLADCDQRGVPCAAVHAAVWPLLGRMRVPAAVLGEAARRSDPARAAREAAGRGEAAAGRLGRARRLYLEGELGEAAWARERLLAERERAGGEDGGAGPGPGARHAEPAALGTLLGAWGAADDAQRRLLARLVIARVPVSGAAVGPAEPTPLGAWLLAQGGS